MNSRSLCFSWAVVRAVSFVRPVTLIAILYRFYHVTNKKTNRKQILGTKWCESSVSEFRRRHHDVGTAERVKRGVTNGPK